MAERKRVTETTAEWVPDVLDPENDQVREVYAHHGLAIYAAQCLEHQLANHVVVTQLGKSITQPEQWDALYEKLFRLPMGGQLKRLLAEAELDEGLVDRLRAALGTRNRLAHSYFRERAAELTSFSGRTQMIEELKTMRDELAAVDEELTAVTFRLLTKWGLTRERVQAEATRMLARHHGRGDA